MKNCKNIIWAIVVALLALSIGLMMLADGWVVICTFVISMIAVFVVGYINMDDVENVIKDIKNKNKV